MIDSLAELIKSFLIPGTFTFLLFSVTIGLVLAWGPRRTRRFGLPLVAAIVLFHWIISVPVVGELLATRLHSRDAQPITADRLAGVKAIVVLGAGVRNSYTVAGHTVTIPDPQTIYNAAEAARIHDLVSGGLPIVASGGIQDGVDETRQAESEILREWLLRAGVPADHIILESGSRTTREQAALVAPLLKSHQWETFVLVLPAVQGPRAAAVFRKQGVSPVVAAAPFSADSERKVKPGWIPNGGGLRVSERAIYDYMAWGYYTLRGWTW
jgi:uncharacterized SAM-binding protein YcdF (DUF218 family)